MKKRMQFLLLVLIAACLAVFYGYRTLDSLRTDKKAPEITMDTQIPELSVKDPKTALLQGITATDHTDGDVTSSLVVESINLLDSSGRLMVSYAAFDSAGNVAKAQREAKYTDYESPKFTMSSPLIYPYGSSFDVLSTVGATDVIDGDIQHRIKATAMEAHSIAIVGTHDVKFQVTNSLGDTSTQIFQVEVYDPATHEADLTLKEYLVYLPKGTTFTPASYLDTFTLRGVKTDLRSGLPSAYSLETKGTVQTQTPGTYPVEFWLTYTIKHATDSERDQKFTGYSKLIVVVEG